MSPLLCSSFSFFVFCFSLAPAGRFDLIRISTPDGGFGELLQRKGDHLQTVVLQENFGPQRPGGGEVFFGGVTMTKRIHAVFVCLVRVQVVAVLSRFGPSLEGFETFWVLGFSRSGAAIELAINFTLEDFGVVDGIAPIAGLQRLDFRAFREFRWRTAFGFSGGLGCGSSGTGGTRSCLSNNYVGSLFHIHLNRSWGLRCLRVDNNHRRAGGQGQGQDQKYKKQCAFHFFSLREKIVCTGGFNHLEVNLEARNKKIVSKFQVHTENDIYSGTRKNVYIGKDLQSRLSKSLL